MLVLTDIVANLPSSVDDFCDDVASARVLRLLEAGIYLAPFILPATGHRSVFHNRLLVNPLLEQGDHLIDCILVFSVNKHFKGASKVEYGLLLLILLNVVIFKSTGVVLFHFDSELVLLAIEFLLQFDGKVLEFS